MEYIVLKVLNVNQMPATLTGTFGIAMRDRPTELFTNEEQACAAAQAKAEENPGEMYVVMKPMIVFEARKPEKIDMVVKQYNQAGELVVMKE